FEPNPDGEDFEYFVLKPGSKSFKLFSIYYTFDIATDFTLPTYSSDGTYKTLVGRMVLGKNAVVKMEGITATTQDGGMTVNNASLEHLSVGKKTTISMVIERGEFVLYIDPR
ncbi:MAG TPA: hypothetical protein PLF96_14115, partial [Thermotogota bacterium]|nr:hypothetical protein [Thermotogota bacterium]